MPKKFLILNLILISLIFTQSRIYARELAYGFNGKIIDFIFQPNLFYLLSELTYEFNGKIIEQPIYKFLRKDYLINPDREIVDLSSWENKFYGDLNLTLNYKKFKFVSKFRPTILSDQKKSDVIKTIIDDAYFDFMFSDGFFLYTGKKNIRDGVGSGSNPTDFLGEEKELDMSKREEERRLEREGNYILGMDTYYKNVTLTAIFAPKIKDLQGGNDRFLFKTSFLMDSINTDVSASYFSSAISGVGFNISTTVNNEFVLYTENAFRRNTGSKIISLIKEGTPNIYEITEIDNKHKIYPHLVTGGHYTFQNGTNIILEYIYNGDGYNDKQWDEFANFLEYNYDEYKKGFATDYMKSNLLQANSLIKFRELRQKYLFMRISNPKIFEKLDGALVVFSNMDDRSFLTNPSLDYNINNNSSLGFSAIIFEGNNKTEFGIMHWNTELTLAYKYFF